MVPSVLWHCRLGARKSIRPVKNWVMRCWWGCLSGARCRLFAYGPADVAASQTPSSLASFKSRLVLSLWYWLTQVLLEKRPLNTGASERGAGSAAAHPTFVVGEQCSWCFWCAVAKLLWSCLSAAAYGCTLCCYFVTSALDELAISQATEHQNTPIMWLNLSEIAQHL